MATGYTCIIEEGATFEEFVMRCARAFGLLIEMRDEPPGTPIPKEFKPPAYTAGEITKAKRNIEYYKNITEQEAQTEAFEHYKKQVAEYKREVETKSALKEQYENMLRKVHDWEPPTKDHIELKTFMIHQIKESIEFDCKVHNRKITWVTGKEWKKEQIEMAQEDIKHYEKKSLKETKRVDSKNLWVKQLRESLKEGK